MELSPIKPAFWPCRRSWPPTKNRHVVAVKETLPPIYILNDGSEVQGAWPIKKRTTTTSTKKKRTTTKKDNTVLNK